MNFYDEEFIIIYTIIIVETTIEAQPDKKAFSKS